MKIASIRKTYDALVRVSPKKEDLDPIDANYISLSVYNQPKLA